MTKPESEPVLRTATNGRCVFFRVGDDRPYIQAPFTSEPDFSWGSVFRFEVQIAPVAIGEFKIALYTLWDRQYDGLLEFTSIYSKKNKITQQARIVGYTHAPPPVQGAIDIFFVYVELNETMLKRKQ